MMNRLVPVMLLTVSLSGCQLQQTIQETSDQLLCNIQPEQMDNWIKLEWNYRQADAPDKQAIEALLREQEDNIGLALLLSQPESSVNQLQQSLELYKSLEINYSALCDSERYLALREQQSTSMLTLKQTLNSKDSDTRKLQQERETLQQQIDALTDIERDISIQKDGEEK